jgi:hypothetical protein
MEDTGFKIKKEKLKTAFGTSNVQAPEKLQIPRKPNGEPFLRVTT